METKFAKKLALIVPYRDRETHLVQFIPYMHQFLNPHIPYRLFIVEQTLEKPFNRGKLLNIGFKLAKNLCDYVCFHDVDMLPTQGDYSYVSQPTHLATHVEQFDFKMPYAHYFGGVTLFNLHDFDLINGYNNDYFGWGLEDDDLRLRCFMHGLSIESREGIFLSLPHEHAKEEDPNTQQNRRRFEKFYEGDAAMLANGLGSLQYEEIKRVENDDFIKVTVSL